MWISKVVKVIFLEGLVVKAIFPVGVSYMAQNQKLLKTGCNNVVGTTLFSGCMSTIYIVHLIVG